MCVFVIPVVLFVCVKNIIVIIFLYLIILYYRVRKHFHHCEGVPVTYRHLQIQIFILAKNFIPTSGVHVTATFCACADYFGATTYTCSCLSLLMLLKVSSPSLPPRQTINIILLSHTFTLSLFHKPSNTYFLDFF